MQKPTPSGELITLGWREWISLPELGISTIKAKIDTGARSSSLHTRYIETFERDGVDMVRFGLRPNLAEPDHFVEAEAPISARRTVRPSSGETDMRFFIQTTVRIGTLEWQAEISLSNRSNMKFRMLLGRQALRGRCLVNPTQSFLTGNRPKKNSSTS